MVFNSIILLCTICFVRAQYGVSRGIHNFMGDIMQDIDGENPADNFVISPFSLHSTFSQALIGAGGRTQAELEELLGVTRSRSLVDEYSKIQENLGYLKIANMLVLNKGFEPKAFFIKFLQDGFGTEMKEFDFSNEKDKSIKEINDIVASKTNQRIKDLISPGDVEENLKMMMINAVYFKAKWKEGFNPQDSFTSSFQSPKLGNVMTKYMTSKMDARMDETDDLQILELPYEDTSKSMIIFLPTSDSSPVSVIDSILRYQTQNIKNIPVSEATVSIPKFEINFQMDLKSKMNNLGASAMFSENANFSYITNQPLKVSDGIHKAFIEVNEEGTEAAAATGFFLSFKSGGGRKRFFANRPFYFMVYDFLNQVPLFMGRLSNPKIEASTKTTIKRKPIVNKENQATKKSFQSNEIPRLSNSNQLSFRSEECRPYLEVFGLALSNNKQCLQKGSRPYEWFVKNRSACMKSQKIYRDFFSMDCGPSWCNFAKQNNKDWKEEYARACTYQQRFPKTPECIKLESNLKAKTFLSCKL
eukprot:GFUD01041104.1.p1 GENE.GFUD01041104.1~~GFUD01041104.1.p1  ORF type:complete len:530 (+),score=111.94 GFUD01041104.1:241-1830(+)